MQVSGLGTVLVRTSCAAEANREGSADASSVFILESSGLLSFVWICLPVDAEWAKPPCVGVCTGAVLSCHVGSFFAAVDVYFARVVFCSNWMLFLSVFKVPCFGHC